MFGVHAGSALRPHLRTAPSTAHSTDQPHCRFAAPQGATRYEQSHYRQSGLVAVSPLGSECAVIIHTQVTNLMSLAEFAGNSLAPLTEASAMAEAKSSESIVLGPDGTPLPPGGAEV